MRTLRPRRVLPQYADSPTPPSTGDFLRLVPPSVRFIRPILGETRRRHGRNFEFLLRRERGLEMARRSNHKARSKKCLCLGCIPGRAGDSLRNQRGIQDTVKNAGGSQVVGRAGRLAVVLQPFGEMALRWHKTDLIYRLILVAIVAVTDLVTRFVA